MAELLVENGFYGPPFTRLHAVNCHTGQATRNIRTLYGVQRVQRVCTEDTENKPSTAYTRDLKPRFGIQSGLNVGRQGGPPFGHSHFAHKSLP